MCNTAGSQRFERPNLQEGATLFLLLIVAVLPIPGGLTVSSWGVFIVLAVVFWPLLAVISYTAIKHKKWPQVVGELNT